MADPFFSGFWDRFPQRRPQRNPYSSHPYAASNVTPTKPEYDYWGAPKVKPRTFTVPVYGPSHHPSPSPSSGTKGNGHSEPNPKKVVSVSVDSETPVSSSGIKKAAVPLLDETSAAKKIQSSFRGFSARKGAPLKQLRVIRDVKAKAEDIRRRLADSQVVESILQNEKERLKIAEGIMSLLLKLDAIQGVSSFVRESRKAVIRELVNLQEMVDVILAGKSIGGGGSPGVEDAERTHGDGLVTSREEDGDLQSLDRSPTEEEIGDEELLERGPSEEGIKDECLPDGVNLAVASAHDSDVQEEGSVISDRIEIHNMQIEAPNHTEGISMVTGSSSGEVSSEVIASKENTVQDQEVGDDSEVQEEGSVLPVKSEIQTMQIEPPNHTEDISIVMGSGEEASEVVASNENMVQNQELKSYDDDAKRDSIDEEKATYGTLSSEGQSREELRASESESVPFTKEEVLGYSVVENKCANSADCEVQRCRGLNDLDLSKSQAETNEVLEQHGEGEVMDFEETREVIVTGAGENNNVEEDIVKVRDENERLKKMVGDLFNKTELQNQLINNLSLRIAQLEEQICNKRKKSGEKKKTKKPSNVITRRRNNGEEDKSQ